MNRDEVNEAISSWFEAKPEQVMMSPRTGEISLNGGWIYSYIPIDGEGFGWRARDWDTDEAANARLLEAMPFPRLAIWKGGTGLYWQCEPDHAKNLDSATHADRKTAIVLAFLKFANLQIPEGAEG